MDYATAKVKLTGATQAIEQAGAALVRAQSSIVAVNNAMATFGTSHAEVIAACDANATASTAWAALKAEKDQLVVDFQALKADAQAMVDALAAL